MSATFGSVGAGPISVAASRKSARQDVVRGCGVLAQSVTTATTGADNERAEKRRIGDRGSTVLESRSRSLAGLELESESETVDEVDSTPRPSHAPVGRGQVVLGLPACECATRMNDRHLSTAGRR